MAQCPCRYCKERYEACHDYCDKYKEWKKPFIEQYANRKAAPKSSESQDRWIRKNLNTRKRQGK